MQPIEIFPWNPHFDTGLPEVDEQHRKLVQLLNELAVQAAFGSDLPSINHTIDALSDYAIYHFQTEEAFWHDYLPGDGVAAQHQLAHEGFVETVQRLKSAQESRPAQEVVLETLGFLTRWLAAHIFEADRYLAQVVLAMRSGLASDAARQQAAAHTTGATHALVEVVLSMYETLSANTRDLMRELSARQQAEEALAKESEKTAFCFAMPVMGCTSWMRVEPSWRPVTRSAPCLATPVKKPSA